MRLKFGPGDEPANVLTSNSGTFTAGASAQLIPANTQRRGLRINVDRGATTNIVYFTLGTATASATNFHFSLGAGDVWNGGIGDNGQGILWNGAVQFYSAATPKVGVIEV